MNHRVEPGILACLKTEYLVNLQLLLESELFGE